MAKLTIAATATVFVCFYSMSNAQAKTCISVVFDVQTKIGATLVHQGVNTIRLAHPAVSEIQITCSKGLASDVDHIWTSAYGTAPDERFNDMVDVLWRIAAAPQHVNTRGEISECLRRAIIGFGPPDYFSSGNGPAGHIDCTYGTIIDGKNNNKVAYAVTLKIRRGPRQ